MQFFQLKNVNSVALFIIHVSIFLNDPLLELYNSRRGAFELPIMGSFFPCYSGFSSRCCSVCLVVTSLQCLLLSVLSIQLNFL